LETLIGKSFFVLQSESYANVPIRYLSLPIGVELKPGYCFIGDYLLIAVHTQLLKSSIDAFQEKTSRLLASKALREIDFGFEEKNRNVQYFRIRELVKKFEKVMDWSGEKLEAKKRKREAFKAGTQRRLGEIIKEIEEIEQQIAPRVEELELLSDEIWQMDEQQQDYSEQQFKADTLKKNIEDSQKELTSVKLQRDELEDVLEGYASSKSDHQTRRIYLEEVIQPILTGLASIHTYGSRTTSEEGILKTHIYFDSQK